MADSFFGFDTSLSNINDDDGGGGDGSEDEYDALNDETFGVASEDPDWEVEHEHMADQMESSRRSRFDDSINSQLEASLSQLVLDETDAPSSKSLNTSNVWQHELQPFPIAPAPPIQPLKNVCTVEELERQFLQKTAMSAPTQAKTQNFFQPRFPVILQRPPGLQTPVPLPFAPQQPMNNMPMNQSMNKLINQNNQMTPNVNQFMQNSSQMIQTGNQFNQMSQNNQMMQGNQLIPNQLSQSNLIQNQLNQSNNQLIMQNQLNQSGNQLLQNINTMVPTNNPLMQNHMTQSNQLLQNINQLSQSNNQILQNLNQMSQSGNQMIQNPIGPSSNTMMQNAIGASNNSMMQNAIGASNNTMLQNAIGSTNNTMMQNAMGPLNNAMMQNPIGPSSNTMMQNPVGPSNNAMMQNPIGPSINSMMQNPIGSTNNTMLQNPIGPSNNAMMQNAIGPSSNAMMQNQMGPSSNLSQANQMMANGNQFGSGIVNSQPMGMPQHMLGQPRMIAPPGLNVSRPNFNSSMGQYPPNFRASTIQSKPMEQAMSAPINQQSFQQQITNQAPQSINQSQAKPNQQINPLNQSPPSKTITMKPAQNQVQRPTDPKVQKNRSLVFNNSTQKTITSQNLVQLIQNTHPMLQFNSFHNANHHPILNNMSNRSNTFNNQLLNNHPIFNNQRNGSFSNNRHLMNGDDEGHSGNCQLDEYAGLMSQREKQWLLNIQMLQLNTGTPYIDDFYYTVFLERQSHKEKEGVKEAHKANQQNHPFYSGGVKQEQHSRSRHNSGRHNSTSEDAPTPRTYVPTQFENSLGKLQCGSVTAPRKIIDVDVVQSETNNTTTGRQSRATSVASTTNPLEAPQIRKTKQVLLDVEALYLILLRLEELNDPLAISNALIMREREDKQKQLELAQKELEQSEIEDSNIFLRNIESVQRKPKTDLTKETIDKRQVVSLALNQTNAPVTKNLLDENKDDLIAKMFAGLLHEDRMTHFMMLRKGKALLVRFCNRVPATHARLRALWSRILRALPSSARRDDGSLTPLAASFKRYIQNTTGWAAVLEACALLSEALDPARTPYILTAPFTLSIICYLIEKAITLVTTADATSSERQWTKFLKTIARALKNTNLKVGRPVQPLSEHKLHNHIKLLESRTTIEILQRGKTASEFADLTKNDFSEQLTKHLC